MTASLSTAAALGLFQNTAVAAATCVVCGHHHVNPVLHVVRAGGVGAPPLRSAHNSAVVPVETWNELRGLACAGCAHVTPLGVAEPNADVAYLAPSPDRLGLLTFSFPSFKASRRGDNRKLDVVMRDIRRKRDHVKRSSRHAGPGKPKPKARSIADGCSRETFHTFLKFRKRGTHNTLLAFQHTSITREQNEHIASNFTELLARHGDLPRAV
tara:strand:+ start:1515 stop:2150 length:636 start_codon:yes stop_codon:yes gene_type:complete